MTAVDIDATYAELQQMFIRLEPSPEKGLLYIAERLTLCRAMQDRIMEMRLQVNQQLTEVMGRYLVAQTEHAIAPNAERKQRMVELEAEKQRLAMLDKMVSAQATLLGRTAQDIRLLKELTIESVKRGQIQPPKELEKTVSVDDLVGKGTTVPEDFPEPKPVQMTPPSYVLVADAEPRVDVGALFANPFDAPPPDRMRLTDVQDVTSVDFESLLSGSTHGHHERDPRVL